MDADIIHYDDVIAVFPLMMSMFVVQKTIARAKKQIRSSPIVTTNLTHNNQDQWNKLEKQPPPSSPPALQRFALVYISALPASSPHLSLDRQLPVNTDMVNIATKRWAVLENCHTAITKPMYKHSKMSAEE